MIESLRFRGSYSTGFRAPNIVELFGGNQTDFPVVDDPCEMWALNPGVDQNTIDNCTADGWGVTDPTDLDEVSLNTEYGFQYQAAFTQLAGGQLGPEESDNFTIGAVWAPEAWGLQASLDYWSIQIDDYIDAPAYNSILRACYSEADRDASPSCAPFGGVYRFDGLAPDGEVPLLNLGELATSGVDFAVDYSTDVSWGMISQFDLSLSGTYLLERETSYPIYGQKEDRVGKAYGDGEIYPEWRWFTWAGIGGDSWTFGWKMRYYSETDDGYRPPELTDDSIAEDMLYHDLKLLYTWNDIEFNLGIDNVTDEDPPRFHSAFNANTEPGVYDVIGRRAWARLNWSF
jgi:iron complex outermembrane receptor protein